MVYCRLDDDFVYEWISIIDPEAVHSHRVENYLYIKQLGTVVSLDSKRRKLLKGIGAGSIVTLAGCNSNNGNGGNNGTGEDASEQGADNGEYHIGFITFSLNLSLFQAYTLAGAWYAEDHDIELTVTDGELSATKQAEDAQNLINSGVDALMMVPADSEAGVNIVENANAENIPVFTTDATVATDEIGMYTGFDNRLAGRRVGENAVNLLEEEQGSPEGSIVELTLQQSTQIGVDRHESFQEVVSNYDEIEVDSLNVGNDQEESATETYNYLQRNPDVDLVATHGLNPMLGAVNALERANLWHPIDHEDHVLVSTIDGGPDLNQYVADSYIDAIFDQPIQFFAPILLKFMTDYLDAGQDEEALPQIGDTYEEGDLDISGDTPEQEVGVNIWEEPLWAPGEVQEHPQFDGQRWWRLPAVELTPENADNPYYWGNWIRDAPSL